MRRLVGLVQLLIEQLNRSISVVELFGQRSVIRLPIAQVIHGQLLARLLCILTKTELASHAKVARRKSAQGMLQALARGREPEKASPKGIVRPVHVDQGWGHGVLVIQEKGDPTPRVLTDAQGLRPTSGRPPGRERLFRPQRWQLVIARARRRRPGLASRFGARAVSFSRRDACCLIRRERPGKAPSDAH